MTPLPGLTGFLHWEKRWRRYWQWLAVVVLLALIAVDLVRVWRVTNHHDLDVFVLAARRLVAGEDIYADAAQFKAAIEAGTFSMKDETVIWPYAYGPLIATLFVPALWMPYSLVQAIWWGANIVALGLGSWFCLRAVGPATPGRMALVLLFLYRFEPAVVALRLGQIELMQYLLLAFALYALNRQTSFNPPPQSRERLKLVCSWESWAGIALGLAAGVKFFPAALIALLVWRRRWRVAAWAAGTAVVAIFGPFALVGWDALGRYLSFASLYGIGGAFAAFPLNQSLNGFFSRNLMRNVFSATLKGLHLPWLAKGLTLGSDGAIILGSAWLTWHRRGWRIPPDEEERQRFSLEYGLAILALLMVSPHSQVYTFVWALIALIVLGLLWLAEPAAPWRWVGLIVAYLLLGRNLVLFRPGLTRFVQAHYLFGALILWGMMGLALWQRARTRGKGDEMGRRTSTE